MEMAIANRAPFELTEEERSIVGRALADRRRAVKEFYEGTREERDELRAVLRLLRRAGCYSDGDAR